MDRIGRGAMGQVFAGRERDSGDEVAIKVLRSELGDDPEFVTRFLQERALLVGLRNANLVHVRDLVAEGDTLAIVMELVKGKDLRRFVGSSRTLPPAEAASLCADVLAGLASAHSAGIVHRDVKPENVIIDLTDPTRPFGKVTDFGIARTLSGPTLTRLSGVMGTPEYMAPELAEERASHCSRGRLRRRHHVLRAVCRPHAVRRRSPSRSFAATRGRRSCVPGRDS